MSRILYRSAFAGAVMLAAAGTASTSHTHHRPANVPTNPTNVETLSFGLGGPCAGFGWHNPNKPRTEVFGASLRGIQAQPGAYGYQRDWTAGEACAGPGWSMQAGLQWGVHPSWAVMNEYVAGGYRVSLGDGVSLAVLAGGIFMGLNRKPIKHPMSANFGGFFPFAAVELSGRF